MGSQKLVIGENYCSTGKYGYSQMEFKDSKLGNRESELKDLETQNAVLWWVVRIDCR